MTMMMPVMMTVGQRPLSTAFFQMLFTYPWSPTVQNAWMETELDLHCIVFVFCICIVTLLYFVFASCCFCISLYICILYLHWTVSVFCICIVMYLYFVNTIESAWMMGTKLRYKQFPVPRLKRSYCSGYFCTEYRAEHGKTHKNFIIIIIMVMMMKVFEKWPTARQVTFFPFPISNCSDLLLTFPFNIFDISPQTCSFQSCSCFKLILWQD